MDFYARQGCYHIRFSALVEQCLMDGLVVAFLGCLFKVPGRILVYVD